MLCDLIEVLKEVSGISISSTPRLLPNRKYMLCIAAIFIMAYYWKSLKCPSAEEMISNNSLFIQRTNILQHKIKTIRMNLKYLMLNKGSKMPKKLCCMTAFTLSPRKLKSNP